MSFIPKIGVTDVILYLSNWRESREDSSVSNTSVSDYFGHCREITEIVASNCDVKLGGPNKTIQVDEAFLTKRKYHRGRITEQMTITVLGIFCKEDKTGLFSGGRKE